MKITTRCNILKLKCTKFYFGWGSAPDPAVELTAPSVSLAAFKGPASNGRRGAKGRGEEKGRGGGEKGREEEGHEHPPY